MSNNQFINQSSSKSTSQLITELRGKTDIELPEIPPAFTRHTSYNAPTRQRVADEKYFRQTIHTYDCDGNQIRSGYIALRSYVDNCEMVRVLNEKVVYPHAFEKWVYYGDDFYNTGTYKVIDLASGCTLPDWEYDTSTRQLHMLTDTVSAGICPLCKKVPYKYCSNITCVRISTTTPCANDVERDMYSEVLLKCLEEHRLKHAPPSVVEEVKDREPDVLNESVEQTGPSESSETYEARYNNTLYRLYREEVEEEIKDTIGKTDEDVVYKAMYWVYMNPSNQRDNDFETDEDIYDNEEPSGGKHYW